MSSEMLFAGMWLKMAHYQSQPNFINWMQLLSNSCQNLLFILKIAVTARLIVRVIVLCLTLDYYMHKLTYQDDRLAMCPVCLLVLEETLWMKKWEL